MKILASIFLIVFVWFAYPHIKRGEWFAPTPVAPYAWTVDAYGQQALATPPEGYGVFHYDFWNSPSPDGRSATRDDFFHPYQ